MGEREKKDAPAVNAQADSEPGHVKTAWTINYNAITRGAGRSLAPRTATSAMYVDKLRIAPRGEAGERDPAPHEFKGVAIAPAGAAHVGTYHHPKDREGQVSAVVGFGGKPRFDFEATSKSPSARRDERHTHAQLVRELTEALDEFVDEVEAQAVLDRILLTKFPDANVSGTIKRFSGSKNAVATTDLRYGPVDRARTFRLKVETPRSSSSKSVTSSTANVGERTQAVENSTGRATETETNTMTAVETQRLQTVKTTLTTALESLAAKVKTTAYKNAHSWSSQTNNGTDLGSETGLSGVIKGVVDIVPDIPVIGWLVKKIAKGTLEIVMNPDFSSSTSLKFASSSGTGGSHDFSFTNEEREQIASKLQSMTETLMSTTLKSSISSAIRVRASASETDKRHDAEKQGTTTNVTTSVGTIGIVAADIQPHLVEE